MTRHQQFEQDLQELIKNYNDIPKDLIICTLSTIIANIKSQIAPGCVQNVDEMIFWR